MNLKRLAPDAVSNGLLTGPKLVVPIYFAEAAEQQNKKSLTQAAYAVYLGRVTIPKKIWCHQC